MDTVQIGANFLNVLARDNINLTKDRAKAEVENVRFKELIDRQAEELGGLRAQANQDLCKIRNQEVRILHLEGEERKLKNAAEIANTTIRLQDDELKYQRSWNVVPEEAYNALLSDFQQLKKDSHHIKQCHSEQYQTIGEYQESDYLQKKKIKQLKEHIARLGEEGAALYKSEAAFKKKNAGQAEMIKRLIEDRKDQGLLLSERESTIAQKEQDLDRKERVIESLHQRLEQATSEYIPYFRIDY